MGVIEMKYLSDTLYRQHSWEIAPGGVGSVGDALVSTRLAQSTPDMPIRVLAENSGDNMKNFGSKISPSGRCIDSRWGGRSDFKTCHGWYIQDLRAPDKLHEPYVGSLGDYSWRNKIATVQELKPAGEYFLPLPGPYILPPGQLPRGGNVPSVTDVVDPNWGTNVDKVVGRRSGRSLVQNVESRQKSFGY